MAGFKHLLDHVISKYVSHKTSGGGLLDLEQVLFVTANLVEKATELLVIVFAKFSLNPTRQLLIFATFRGEAFYDCHRDILI